MPGNIKNVMAAIDYIESHLHEKLDLETVAGAVHYSKYHLHRMFTGTVGLTIHDYVQRRQLTEAAKLLVLSDQSLRSRFLPDMRASSPLRIFSKPCIKNPLTGTGRKKNFIHCS